MTQSHPLSAMEQHISFLQIPSVASSWYTDNLHQTQKEIWGSIPYTVGDRLISHKSCQCRFSHSQQAKCVYWQIGKKYTTLGGVVPTQPYSM